MTLKPGDRLYHPTYKGDVVILATHDFYAWVWWPGHRHPSTEDISHIKALLDPGSWRKR